mgnify:CR=1 FL=1
MVNMKIDHFVVGPVQTNCYFVTNIKTKEMIIIDLARVLISSPKKWTNQAQSQ